MRGGCFGLVLALWATGCAQPLSFIERPDQPSGGARSALLALGDPAAPQLLLIDVGPDAPPSGANLRFRAEDGAPVTLLFYAESSAGLLLEDGPLPIVPDALPGRHLPSPWLEARCGVQSAGHFELEPCTAPAALAELRLPYGSAEQCIQAGGCVRGQDADLRCQHPCVLPPITPPQPPMAPEPPKLLPCPQGWSPRPNAARVCEPDVTPMVDVCPPHNAPFLAGCRAPGDPCVSQVDASEWPPARVLRVPAGTDLDLAASAADDAVLLLEAGDYSGLSALRPAQTLVGLCAERTRVLGSGPLLLSGAGRSNLLRGLTLVGMPLSVEAGAELVLEGVALTGPGAFGAQMDAATLRGDDVWVRGLATGIAASSSASVELHRLVVEDADIALAISDHATLFASDTTVRGSERALLAHSFAAVELERALITGTSTASLEVRTSSLSAIDLIVLGGGPGVVLRARTQFSIARSVFDATNCYGIFAETGSSGSITDVDMSAIELPGAVIGCAGIRIDASPHATVDRFHIRYPQALGIALHDGDTTATDVAIEDGAATAIELRGAEMLRRITVQRVFGNGVILYANTEQSRIEDLLVEDVVAARPPYDGLGLDVRDAALSLARVTLLRSETIGLRATDCVVLDGEDVRVAEGQAGIGTTSPGCLKLTLRRVAIVDTSVADIAAGPGVHKLYEVVTGSVSVGNSPLAIRLEGGTLAVDGFVFRHRRDALDLLSDPGPSLLSNGRVEDCQVLIRRSVPEHVLPATLNPPLTGVAADCPRITQP